MLATMGYGLVFRARAPRGGPRRARGSFLVLLGAVACKSPVASDVSSFDAGPRAGVDVPPDAGGASRSWPAPSAEDAHAFALASNALGFDLFARTRADGGNLAFSPFSIASALTMLWGGARNETAAEIGRVLRMEGPPERSAETAGRVASALNAAGSGAPAWTLANGLFGDKAYVFAPAYLEHTRAAFGASLESVDFQSDPEGARLHINEWVSARTDGHIHDLLAAGSIDHDARLVLINALHFLGAWAEPFEKAKTAPAAFHPSARTAMLAPTMHAEEEVSFAAIDGVKVLDLHYAGDDTTMTLVLPDAVDGLPALEKKTNQVAMDRWLGGLTRQRVTVALPRFEVDPAKPMSLSNLLEAMGMRLAFDRARADLSAIADSKKPEDRLYVGAVLHKAVVKVDETGTEATAATTVTATSAAALPGTKAAEFVADHPFLFFVRDLRSGLILFLGRVAEPVAR